VEWLKRYYAKKKDGSLDNLKKARWWRPLAMAARGHAHALNLRDSGADVVVGLCPGSKSWQKSRSAGLQKS